MRNDHLSVIPTDLTLLRVSTVERGRQIVDATGHPIRLRGVAVGGWMNMENYINGYPGAEHSLRRTMADVLGREKAAFFFDRWLDHFFTEDDVAFIKGLGANVVRLALNYRHFEDDRRPFRYLEAGFERLDRAIAWCARHDVYAILDLHAAPGWQNPDWHSDNRHKHALMWQHPHFQDRLVALWEEFARRYRGNPVIAGYDILNEPETRDLFSPNDWPGINCVYRRVVEAISFIDPDHIIFLEGDTFASRFEGLDAPFADNLVYSTHDYSIAGFGPGPYPGVIRGRYRDHAVARQIVSELRGVTFAREHNVPIWVGEFGAVYNGPVEERPDRLRALDDQIDAFEQHGIHWTIWTYKDVGVMGVVTVDLESEYMRLVAPILAKKVELGSDSWMRWLPKGRAHDLVYNLAAYLHEAIANPDVPLESLDELISDLVVAGHTATLMQPAYAALFEEMSEEQIDDVLQSFALHNCQPHEGLVSVLRKHMLRSVPSAV